MGSLWTDPATVAVENPPRLLTPLRGLTQKQHSGTTTLTWSYSVKVGDLVVATRKENLIREDARNRYMGIFIKRDYGDLFVECFTGDRTGRFSPDFWDVEVVSENR